MKDHVTITIGRSFGSCGREIGEKLAKKLEFSFYDRNLISMAAERTGMDEDLLESADEHVLSRFIDPYAVAGAISDNTNLRLYRAECKIIREIASRESSVIVGRLADYVLRGDSNCLKVFIYAPFEKRMQTIMKKHALSEHEAKRLIKQMDKMRKSYYSYFTDRAWDGVEGRDMLIDSSLFGVDGTVDLLEEVVRKL